MTIIPVDKLASDPQHLLYHFPSIHPVKYTKMSAEYHFWRSVAVAEQVAKMSGKLLIPATCLHWERKVRHADRRLQIGKKSFFVMSQEELTNNELHKYMQQIEPMRETI